MPLGASDAGDTTGYLRFFTPDFTNPGLVGINAFVPASYKVTRTEVTGIGVVITKVETGNNTIELSASPVDSDQNAFKVSHKDLNNNEFRVTKIYLVKDDNGNPLYLRVDSTYAGSTFRYQQSQPTPGHYVLESGPVIIPPFGPDDFTVLRVESLAVTKTANAEIHRKIVVENGATVSDIATTWENCSWGWEKIKEVIEPDGTTPLTSTWSYFTGEGTGPAGSGDAGSNEGYGRLKEYVRYDGYMETHTYWTNNHQTMLPFAGVVQGLKLSRQWSNGHTTLTTIRTVGTKTLSEESETYASSETAPTITTTSKASTGTVLTTIATLKPYGARFGGQPASVLHPDGTLTTYEYEYTDASGTKTVTSRTTGTNGTITEGTETVTVTNRQGNVVESTTTAVGTGEGMILDRWIVGKELNIDIDSFGRPLKIRHFPSGATQAWTSNRAYNCCGLAMETDRHGIPTYYAYDGLRRQIKSNTLGVTTQNTYIGLTTETRRYLETVDNELSAFIDSSPGTLIARTTRNLAGTSTTSSAPDPSSDDDGALVSTNTATTYNLTYLAGVLTTAETIITTTVPDGTQTTVTYPDSRIASTYGDLQPGMTYGYGVGSTDGIGLITTSTYLEAAGNPVVYHATAETTVTTADWAGRTRNITKGTESTTYAYYSSNGPNGEARRGKLASVEDADHVKTIYDYNSLGERTTTALSLNGDFSIDYGIDQITRTETQPFTRPNGGPTILRTKTLVWQDGTEVGTVASYTDRTPDGSETWISQDGSTETHISSVSSIGLNFSDGSVATTLVSDALADGFANWTDSRALDDTTNPAVQSTPIELGASDVFVTWISSSSSAAGSQANNEQALYRKYLADGQTDPTNTDFGGSSSDGIGVRVRITGLAGWLAAHGHTAYQIRAYSSSNSEDDTFQLITIHDGDAASQTILGTIAPAVMGQADYPTGFGGSPAPRGYGDSADSLTADTITLTIPVCDNNICGTLAAIKITGLVIATTSAPDGSWAETTAGPDQTRTVTTYSGGRPLTATRYGSDKAFVSTVTYGFDSMGRPAYTTDSRTGTTTTTCVSATCDMVASVSDPGSRTTSFTYDSRGHRLTVDAPDTTASTNVTTTEYDSYSRVKTVTGAGTYPVSYTYDYAGRKKTMTTTGGAGGTITAITAWNYDPATGLLTSKRYDSDLAGATGTGPDYDYTAGGRLWHRQWARLTDPSNNLSPRVLTTYGYTHGLLTTVTYNDGTPDVTYNYDAFPSDTDINHLPGTLETVTQAGRTWTYKYDSSTFRPLSETQPLGGTDISRTLTRAYDSGRPGGFTLGTTADTDSDHTVSYGFDAAGRLDEVTGAGKTFNYGYQYVITTAPAPVTRKGDLEGTLQDVMPYRIAGPKHTATRAYEPTRDALASIQNQVGTATISAYAYAVNALGQRDGVTTGGSAFGNVNRGWGWGYDALGQLTSATHAVTATLNRGYSFDAIGNRLTATDGSGESATTTAYTPDPVNQYDAIGSLVPAYDADGNLRADAGVNTLGYGLKFGWDAENRLTTVSKADNTPLATYSYDYLGRRIRKTTTTDAIGGATDIAYLYDGWNVAAEYTLTTEGATITEALLQAYTWGLDLSGTLQGAGGVGGLLCIHRGPVWTSGTLAWTDAFYPTYDGNGNVSEYLDRDGNQVAHFEYDPFGRIAYSTGVAGLFNYRFSTKPQAAETGLYYYGLPLLRPADRPVAVQGSDRRTRRGEPLWVRGE